MENILKTTNLKKYYGSGDTMVKALDGINLEIERGTFTAIIGTSGSGKSTLLNMLGGLDTPTNNLSGGQQQRVAIARALASKPSIILADEPTGNLDSKTSNDVIGLLKMTGKEFQQTIVMITHNPEIAQMADRIVRIEDGRIVA